MVALNLADVQEEAGSDALPQQSPTWPQQNLSSHGFAILCVHSGMAAEVP